MNLPEKLLPAVASAKPGKRVVDVLDEMTEVFLAEDALLASAGVFPVYFWFVCNINEKHYHRIRKFLVEIEDARRQNWHLIPKNPKNPKIDRNLAQYNKFNRGTDDTQSHRVQYDLLKEQLKEALEVASLSS
jgi:hypothetical protein